MCLHVLFEVVRPAGSVAAQRAIVLDSIVHNPLVFVHKRSLRCFVVAILAVIDLLLMNRLVVDAHSLGCGRRELTFLTREQSPLVLDLLVHLELPLVV